MKVNNTLRKSILFLTRSALIAAIYAVLAYLSSPLQFWFFQFRLSEALCVLAVFMPDSIVGLTVGCLIANYLTGCIVWDVVFGTLATLLGAVGAYLIGRALKGRLIWLSTLPTIISNTLIVPFVIVYAYGSEGSLFLFAFTVFVGEALCAGVLGSILGMRLKKLPYFSKKGI